MEDNFLKNPGAHRILNRDIIKYIAASAMLLNHIANVFLASGTLAREILTDIGYFTAITMCFFLVEGYDYTRSKRAYARRLLVCAVLSELPFCLAFTENGILEFCGMNMMYTLWICFWIVHVMKQKDRIRNTGLIVVLLVLATVYSDWGGLAPLFTFWFVRTEGFPEERRKVWVWAALLFGLLSFVSGIEQYAIGRNLLSAAGNMAPIMLAGVCIEGFYNGRRMEHGRSFSKWFFYIFYPAHLLVLGLLRQIV